YYSKETSQKLSCLLNNPYLKSREFQINLDSALNNYLVYEDMKCELSSILSDSELPNFDLLDFFLQKWTKKQVENNLNLIKKHADISSYEPFIKERNQAILASSLLSETILYKFTRSYVSEKDDKGKALTDKLAQTLIKRQKQILQEAYKIESFCSYVKSVAAQDDLLATINYLAEFKTTSKSFLLTKEQKKELLKKFIRGYAPICEFADQIGIYIATKKEINTKNSNKLFTFFRGKEQKKKKIELAQFLHAVLEEYLENPAFNQLRNVLEELNVVKHALLTTLELREKTNFVSAVSEIIKILTPFVDNTLPNNPLLSVAIDTQKNASLQPCKQQFFKKTKEFTEKPSMLVTQQFHFK
ncbi:MAG: hypothetical protein REH83_06470, partial [Rickettsiella sp.]|nr:hypothetical protein [Rickettsiella sp.]